MDVFVKCLAILGGAGLGAFLGGWLLSWVHRARVQGQNVPSWATWVVRSLSAIAGGLLTYWIVFGGGGGGLGGAGGWYGGTKDPNKEGKEPAKEEKPKEKESPAKEPGKETLTVEVLGPEVLDRLKIPRARCYRLSPESEPVERGAVIDAVKAGLAGKPRLKRVEYVLYKDSPIEGAEPVKKLKEEIKDVDAELDVRMGDKRQRPAPVE
ncbi:MAG: hypothetical protein K2W96_13890 [Gemmataceae bacterium]|nr:hypothetical protein [Gemmataceae bacterium]